MVEETVCGAFVVSEHSNTQTDFEHELRSAFVHHLPWAFLSISGLPWAGSVQRGVFIFEDLWARVVFWPDTCLVELTKSYDQFQSLMFSSKVLRSVPKSLCSVPKSYDQFHSLMFSSKVLCSGSKV